jgi:pimeloyl-ACP methyl ester carboxylesterase
MRALTSMDPRAFWLSLRGLMAARGSDVLGRVRVPTLVAAAKHDLLIPRSQMLALHAGIPGARYVEIADAGHANLLEAGPEIAAQIRLFLRGAGVC